MRDRIQTLIAIVVAVAIRTGETHAQTNNPPMPHGSGIWQLIEERSGKTSCWGAVIQVSRLAFPKVLQPSAIEITEAKHGRRLNDLMLWEVDPTRKRLTIKFRPNRGDFGTGNRIEIKIKRQDLEPGSAPSGSFVWVIETDPL